MKIKYLLIMLMALVGISANAQTFEYTYEGSTLRYNITSETNKNCEVAGGSDLTYELSIPDVVTYNGQEYRVTSIRDKAFENCSYLTSVIIGNSVTSIGNYAFNKCSNIKAVKIYAIEPPNLPESAFSGLYNTATLAMPKKSLKEYLHSSWAMFKSLKIADSDVPVKNYSDSFLDYYLVAAESETEKNIAIVKNGNYESLTSIVIPERFTADDSQRYYVTEIGYGAFKNCKQLKEVTFHSKSALSRIGEEAFMNTRITTITLPKTVTSIGKGAFYECPLSSFTLPESVVEIADKTFYNCTGLTSVTIPNSVTEIGNYAFYGCSGLTSVTIPNTVTSIGSSAFSACRGLTSVTIPNSITSISSSAFRSTALTSVTIPNTVTSIGMYAFADCSRLSSVTIPNSVTTIGKGAFWNCSYLTSVTVPNSVTKIGEYAFYGCSHLTSVTIPNSVTSIENGVFENCAWLTSVTIPNSVTSIGGGAFTGCTALESMTIPNSVTSIGREAFLNCWKLLSVTIPNSVTTIGNAAFFGCQKLPKITIPNSVTLIGDSTFYYCTQLTSVTIPNSVTSIGREAFAKCPSLPSVTIPNSVTSIGRQAFYLCTDLTSVTIPNSVTSIDHYAFYQCDNLTSVVIGNSLASFPSTVFAQCPKLAEFTIEDGDLPIAFPYYAISTYPIKRLYIGRNWTYPVKTSINRGISSVTLGNKVTELPNYAFADCSGLTSVSISSSVTSIGENAFSGCVNLAEFTIEDGDLPIAFPLNALSDSPIKRLYMGRNWTYPAKAPINTGISSVTLGNKVTELPNYAFADCSGLTSVSIPNSVTSIGENAFYRCGNLAEFTIEDGDSSIAFGINALWYSPIKNLYMGRNWTCPSNTLSHTSISTGISSVTLGNKVTELPNYAFAGCGGLTSVTIPNSVTSVGESAFARCSSLSSVSFGSGVKTISKDAFTQSNLSKVVLPPAVETIESSAFANNLNLKEVAMGANITSIGDKAFNQAPVEKVFITTPEPPTASASVFSRYTAKLYVQGNAAVDAYYDALNCWDRFDGYVMSEPQSLTMAEPTTKPLGNAGETFTLKATLTPANVDLPYVFWRSTDPTKAYVDNDGKVTVLQDITAEDNLEIIAETLYHKGPVAKFSFYPVSTGVDDIVGDIDATMDVFTLQGVQVLRNATREQFENLASGIYIVRSGKSVKKIVK